MSSNAVNAAPQEKTKPSKKRKSTKDGANPPTAAEPSKKRNISNGESTENILNSLYDEFESMLDDGMGTKEPNEDTYDRGYEAGYTDALCSVLNKLGGKLVRKH